MVNTRSCGRDSAMLPRVQLPLCDARQPERSNRSVRNTVHRVQPVACKSVCSIGGHDLAEPSSHVLHTANDKQQCQNTFVCPWQSMAAIQLYVSRCFMHSRQQLVPAWKLLQARNARIRTVPPETPNVIRCMPGIKLQDAMILFMPLDAGYSRELAVGAAASRPHRGHHACVSATNHARNTLCAAAPTLCCDNTCNSAGMGFLPGPQHPHAQSVLATGHLTTSCW